jgi:hypothetical protein
MAKYELKTKKNDASVEDFINGVTDDQKRKDCQALLELMGQATGEEPVMWGSAIIGFGNYHYKYASGQEGDWFLAGFSPRKQNLTLYIMAGFEQFDDLLSSLGKYKTSVSCLYVNKLSDINLDVLGKLIRLSVDHMRKTNPE